MTLASQINEYVRAGFSGLWIETSEPNEAERDILTLCAQNRSATHQWQAIAWDIATGFHHNSQQPGDPLAPLKAFKSLQAPDTTSILILHNYHAFLKNPLVWQSLWNHIIAGKSTGLFYCVLSHSIQIPPELEKAFVVLTHERPDLDTLEGIAIDLEETGGNDGTDPPEKQNATIHAASGLTRYEAEGAFALSLVRHNQIKPDTIWEIKESILKKSGLLTLHRGNESFANLGGLDTLKQFCTRALEPNRTVQPRGIMLLGVPGTGKSAFAKALGNETFRPTLTLDIGSLMGSRVGQTEANIRQALQIADAMSPCILFIDEIEKALSGAGAGNLDSGVSTRLFGTLLTWLSDHTTNVFVVATSNDISQLPPEFSRAERWDAVFFLDQPNRDEKDAIWDLYQTLYDRPNGTGVPNDDQWTGAEIKACCRLASLLNVPLTEAAQHVVPVAVTAADKVHALREWATGRCLSASHPGIYHHNHTTKPSKRRSLQCK